MGHVHKHGGHPLLSGHEAQPPHMLHMHMDLVRHGGENLRVEGDIHGKAGEKLVLWNTVELTVYNGGGVEELGLGFKAGLLAEHAPFQGEDIDFFRPVTGEVGQANTSAFDDIDIGDVLLLVVENRPAFDPDEILRIGKRPPILQIVSDPRGIVFKNGHFKTPFSNL